MEHKETMPPQHIEQAKEAKIKEIKKRYPREINIEGLDPAFSCDLREALDYGIALGEKKKEEEIVKMIYEIDERLDRGDSWSHGIRDDLLSSLSNNKEIEHLSTDQGKVTQAEIDHAVTGN